MDPVTRFLRRTVEFFEELFSTGPATPTVMNVRTAGQLGPLGRFMLSLGCDPAARQAWLTNRQKAIDDSGLPQADRDLLTGGDARAIATRIVAESGGSGPSIWICVWIR